MFFTQYFLLLILIYESISNTNQDDLSNHQQLRIKRFFSRKSSKLNSRTRSKNDEQEHLLFNKGYTQQGLAEIKRILSKKEDDYYGILGINNPATSKKIIMRAYQNLTLWVHPDKMNVPGATQAMQRLNKARTELLRRLEYANQNNYQRKTQIWTTQSSTINENKHHEISNLLSTFSPLPSEPKNSNSIFQNSHYILFGSVILIIGIVIFIIYWMKRQRRLFDRNYSKKPESNDGRSKNRDSEISILQDDE